MAQSLEHRSPFNLMKVVGFCSNNLQQIRYSDILNYFLENFRHDHLLAPQAFPTESASKGSKRKKCEANRLTRLFRVRNQPVCLYETCPVILKFHAFVMDFHAGCETFWSTGCGS